MASKSQVLEKLLDRNDLQANYDLPKVIEWITKNSFKKVSLQFPNELLNDAPAIASIVEKQLGVQVFILADTSFGSCCVDEGSAFIVGADCVIHFGPSCLTPTTRLPVLYIFENLNLDEDKFTSVVLRTFGEFNNCILVVSDLRFHQSAKKVVSNLRNPNIIYLKPHLPTGNSEIKDDLFKKSKYQVNKVSVTDNHIVLYIGEQCIALTNLMLAFPSCTFYTYSPTDMKIVKQTLGVNQLLRKRYYVIEKAKDATMFGILVATLAVADYLEIIEQAKKLITSANKKFYTFVVGKLNPNKLANFPEIDCYVIIACPEMSLLENAKDFYRPVITPFELEVALNSGRSWTGNYITDFRNLLPGAAEYVAIEADSCEPTTNVSLISGRINSIGQSSNFENTTDCGGKDSSSLQFNSKNALNPVDSGSNFLSQRIWKGLEPRVGEYAVTAATTGRSGLAANYSNEKSD